MVLRGDLRVVGITFRDDLIERLLKFHLLDRHCLDHSDQRVELLAVQGRARWRFDRLGFSGHDECQMTQARASSAAMR